MSDTLKKMAEQAMRINPVEKDKKPDRYKDGTVRHISSDGTYMVALDEAPETPIACVPYCTAMVNDRVAVVLRADGVYMAVGRQGGDIGGGGIVVTQVDDVSNYVAGRVFAHAGTNDPAGALLCDGRAVSRREYWELFDAIGTTYGAGDGNTTFNLPNIESRTIIGESDSYALGSTGGEEEHTLTVAEMPSHKHDIIHRDASGSSTSWGYEVTGGSGITMVTSPWSVSGTGDDQPHNNMQPYIVMRYFITTGKGDPVSGINPADYVVEWGKTGEWRWEKWASGKAECWLSKWFDTATGYATWGNGYITREQLSARTYPFEFTDYPIVDAEYHNVDGGYDLTTIMSQGTIATSPVVRGFRPSAVGEGITERFQVTLRAVGFWKDSPASGGVETIAPTIAERFDRLEGDYIVAEGMSDIWTWRKWSSGLAECWGTKTVTTNGFSAWGGMYIGWTGSGAVALPFEFAEVPTFGLAATSDTTSSLGVVAYGGTNKATPSLEVFRSNNPGAIAVKYQFTAKGRWK